MKDCNIEAIKEDCNYAIDDLKQQQKEHAVLVACNKYVLNQWDGLQKKAAECLE